MIATVLLPLADFKTITVPSKPLPAPSNLVTELVGAGLVMVLILLVMLLPRLWRSLRPQPKPTSEPSESWILIDGSNVMHWQDHTPQLESLHRVVGRVQALGYFPGVVFDANAGWKLAGRYLHDGDFADLLGLEPRQVLVVPKGTQADTFLLDTARELGARIVTNDRFRDWADKHPELAKAGFLVRGGLRGQDVWLAGLEPVQEAAAQG